MPDKWNFDHLPRWGAITHRCIEEQCNFPGPPSRPVPELEREQHFRKHVREREKAAAKRKRDQAATARRAKRMKEREDKLIEERYATSDRTSET